MEVILMNKNKEVLVAEYNTVLKGFDEILEYRNMDYAPFIIHNLFSNDKNILTELSKWFRGRGIPEHRDNLEMLLARLNITLPEELLDKSFGLSLSDQYWLKPNNSVITYEDINFFDHDFDGFEFMEATFSDKGRTVSELSLKTPNNTTDGMLKKSWVIENGRRYLLKGDYRNEQLQPFNEVLGTMICERLGFDHVKYSLDIVKGTVVSKCECFISKDSEYIPAYQVMNSVSRKYNNEDYYAYIKILESYGIENVREKIDNMLILDFIIMNNDRHLNNFGIIRDVNTLQWLDVAPIFDNGQSLNIKGYSIDEMTVDGVGRFFYETLKFDDIIKNVDAIDRIDITKLDGVVEDFDNLLHEYQYITKMSDERISNLCILLNSQIKKLKKLIEN